MLTASTTIWISSGYYCLLFPIHEVKRTFHSLVSLVSDICITKPTAAAIMVRKKRCINYLLENHFNYLHLFLSSPSLFPSSTGTFSTTTTTSPCSIHFSSGMHSTRSSLRSQPYQIDWIHHLFGHSRQRQQMLLLDKDIGFILFFFLCLFFGSWRTRYGSWLLAG
jgi:hypothetical protein